MTEIGNFIVAHWETILGVLLLLLATDGIAGYLPDKWVPYVGAVKRVAQILLTRFGKGVPIILAMLMLSGCAGLKLEETAAPMAIPPPVAGTAAELAAATETGLRSWSPKLLADTFAGATVEVQNEAFSVANASGDLTHAPSQDSMHDWAVQIDVGLDGDIDALDSAMSESIADLTLTGAAGLVLGVAGSVQGTIRWFSNTPANNFHFDMYGSNFTENFGWRIPTGYPAGANYLLNVDADGTMGYTDPSSLGSMTNPMTTAGDIIYGGAAGTPTRLAATANNDYVLAYNTGTNAPYWKQDANTGSATPLNDIADSTADGSVAQAGYKLTLTSTLNSAGSIWTFTNTTADLTADVSFIDLKYTDDGDANGFFMRGYDNAGNDLKWSIAADGAATFSSFSTSAADGQHYITATNTVDIAATATAGRYAYGPVSGDATSRHRIADGTDWNNYFVDKESIDTPAELETVAGLGAFASDLLGYATAANVASGIGVGTEDSPQFTAIEVGAASDTTLARVGAGQVSVEGVNVVTTSSTDTLTNKTIDTEATGNSLTTVEKIWIMAAGCNNATAASFLDLPTANAAAAACITGTNTQKGVLDFDAATDESAQITHMLPSDAAQLTSGNGVDIAIKWLAASTTGSVVWGVQTSCVATAETDDPSWNTASTVTDAALGTTLQTNDAAIADVTATGCAAGELLHLRVYRDADNASDDMAGDARLIGLEVTYRRAQ